MSILLEAISYTYTPDMPDERYAIEDINLTIERGDFIGLLGHTGSGKSTLVQLIAGLLEPMDEGRFFIDGIDFKVKSKARSQKKRDVGIVFQYPEHQLFEETVEKDIAFGPKNLGLSDSEVKTRVKEAMALVDLDYERYKDESPFSLSGGQKRRVAIAGVLAMRPSYLILDEPTAGLDPKGRSEILKKIKVLHEALDMAIILVSHSMDDVAEFANRLLVMNHGKLILEGTPKAVFKEEALLKEIGLGIPSVQTLIKRLNERGFGLREDILTLEEAYQALNERLKGEGR